MKTTDPARKKRRVPTAAAVLFTLLVLLGFLCFFSARWYIRVYGDTSFASIVYTLTVNLGGVQSDLVSAYLWGAALPTVLATAAVCAVLFWQPPRRLIVTLWDRIRIRLYPLGKKMRGLCALLLCVLLITYSALAVGLPQYIADQMDQSVLYDTVYVDPAGVDIRFPDEKKNLIYILMESMETTFFSQEQGGGLSYNCIPELYQLAEENINFSPNDSVGGFIPSTLGHWTIAAMVGQTAGLPLVTPPGIGGAEYGLNENFLPGATTLMDILHENGYYQTLMVGSDATFGGRLAYYTQHNVDKVYDLFTAREDGLIPEDYYVWWGFEDLYLYEYARQELTEIAAQEQPFAFTMLTVDTHHIGGYACAACGSEHAEQYENVYACASRQLAEFIDWLQQQDFWEDTVVIISGDHRSMDQAYMDRAIPEGTSRRVYNCFINSQVQPVQSKNRQTTTLDMFPTTLAALGCTIEGDRLALGTNLFSDTPTLAEELGIDTLNRELGKTSNFFMENLY